MTPEEIAAAKRLQTIREGQLRNSDLRIVYRGCSVDECERLMAVDEQVVIAASLAAFDEIERLRKALQRIADLHSWDEKGGGHIAIEALEGRSSGEN